jgi:hypothetical protein
MQKKLTITVDENINEPFIDETESLKPLGFQNTEPVF